MAREPYAAGALPPPPAWSRGRRPDIAPHAHVYAPSEGSSGGHTGRGNSPWRARGRRLAGRGRQHGAAPLTESEGEDGRAQGQQPGGGKRDLVGAQPDAEEAAAVG